MEILEASLGDLGADEKGLLRNAIYGVLAKLEIQSEDSALRNFGLFEYIDLRSLEDLDVDWKELGFVKFKNLGEVLELLGER
jgi:hypothetical protein